MEINRMMRLLWRLLTIQCLVAAALFAQVSPVVTITGYVYDEVSFEPLNNVLIIVKPQHPNLKEWTSKTHSGGYYLITGLHPGEKYTLRLRKAGYFETEYELRLPKTEKYTELSRDFLMKPLRVGTRIPLTVSPFPYKKAKFKLGAEEILDDLVNLLKINPSVHIRLEVYPDTETDTTFNLSLTTTRAQLLAEYLTKHGISPDRLEIAAFTRPDPLNPPPVKKRAKGKFYVGPVYIVVTKL